MGIAIAHDHSEQQSGDSAGDRYEAPSAEESQIFRQRDGREAVVEVAADQAREDADRDLQPVDQADRPILHRQRRDRFGQARADVRSEEHTSELQSLMRISYAVVCLKKKNDTKPTLLLTNQ